MIMEKSHPEGPRRAAVSGGGAGPHADEPARPRRWNYTTGIKFYHEQSKLPVGLSSANADGLEPGFALPGIVCQAARELLGLTQMEISKLSEVSKKTINDFENGKVEPRGRVVRALREALEGSGARFLRSGDAVGVSVSRPLRKADDLSDQA